MNKYLKKSIASLIILLFALYTLPVYAFENKETVYTKVNTNGDNYKTIVTTKENNQVKQEDSDKELPLEVKISYKLDNKDISAEELAGKSGRVSIKIEYINKSAKQVSINGNQETMYTPFIVAVGTIIDGENNKNIEVKNGKIIDNGKKSVVAGVLMPGLSESLKLTGDLASIEIPSSMEITMDSTNFEMKNIISYATPKLLDSKINWNKLDDLFNTTNKLQSSMDQIEDGANKLADGTNTLKEGTNELSEGISTAYNGSKTLKEKVANSVDNLGADKQNAIDENTLSYIGNKASQAATTAIKEKLETIGESAKKSATDTIKENLEQIGNQASQQATQGVNAKIPTIAQATLNGIKQKLSDKEKLTNIASAKLQGEITDEAKKQLKAGVSTAVSQGIQSNATDIVKQAATQGVKSVSKELENLASSVTANAGDVDVGTVSVTLETDCSQLLNENSTYNELDDETKAKVLAIVGDVKTSIETEAGKKATQAAKTAAQTAANNAITQAETSAKTSATQALAGIAQTAATNAASNAAQNATNTLVQSAVEIAVTQTSTQLLSMMPGKAVDMIEEIIDEKGNDIATEVVSGIVSNVVPAVASDVAKSTATQVAGEVANKTASSVAEQVAYQVSGQTATSVANEVANEVKNKATESIKTQLEVLLNEGLVPLSDGLGQLDEGSKKLNSGAQELNEGTNQLKDGIQKFNNEGIRRITGFINGDLNKLTLRAKKLEELSNEFNSFSSDKKREDIKFITIIDSIKKSAKEIDNQELVIDTNNDNKNK